MEINLYTMLKFWRSFKWEFIKGRKEPEQITDLDKQVFREEEDKGTAREIFIKGVKLWEGIYNNQVSKDTGIVYDDFGVNGFVKVKVNIIFEDDYRKDNNIPKEVDLLEGRGENIYQKFAYIALIDNKEGKFLTNLPFGKDKREIKGSRSYVTYYAVNFFKKEMLGVIYRYQKMFGILLGDFEEFLYTIAHEAGHMFGLGDAYDRSDESSKSDENTKYMVGAKVTNEIPENDIMFSKTEITPNDIEMILEAWKTTIHQVFYDAPEIWYKKSLVIKQERKDAK